MDDKVKFEGSETFDEKQRQHVRKFTEGLLKKELIRRALNLKSGQTLLDAGCGNGYMSKFFSVEVTPSGKVYALDANEYFIKTLKDETQGTNIVTIEGDITRTVELYESSIDIIYISTVIHIFSKQQMRGFIREAQRLLKPEALLAIVEIEKKETPFGPPMENRYSPEELMEIVPMVPVDTVLVGEYFYMQLFQNRAK